MVISSSSTKPLKVTLLPRPGSRTNGPATGAMQAGGAATRSDCIVVKVAHDSDCRTAVDRDAPDDEVIDLGAPRLRRREPAGCSPRRRPSSYTPNPRLYPGPPKPEPKSKRTEGRRSRRKRVYKRPVPNARLYRPAPPRAQPPPPSPWRGSWPPPPPRSLVTASLAALRLSQNRPEPSPPCRPEPPPPLLPSRRLVVTLPAQRPNMDAAPSRTPDDGSDGNDPTSAPSEFLAEFLSAIMQRQYAEALKYCRLILQYEPHNATARGFYSLLQHKVAAGPAAPPAPVAPPSSAAAPCRSDAGCGRLGGSSDGSRARRRRASPHEMEQEADASASSSSAAGGARLGDSQSDDESQQSDDSCASQSSLEMDSSPSLSLSRRTDHTDSASGSGAGWESTATPPSSGSGSGGGSGGGGDASAADDNGNAPPATDHTNIVPESLHADDVQNDNDHTSPLKSESAASLRRLRAQFACSIK